MTKLSASAEETMEIAKEFAKECKPNDVLAFCGDLGAGKTTFVQGFAKGLGISDYIVSPTFAILNEYHGNLSLYHFDVYRLAGEDDLYNIGFFDYLEAGGICAIEWSENIAEFLPPYYYRVTLEQGEMPNQRKITIEQEERG